MASQPLPCTDGQNNPIDISSRVAVISFITSASSQGTPPQVVPHSLLSISESISLLLPGIPSLDSVSHKDVYTNEPFVKLLKVITELGRCAQSDLEECQKLQQRENKVFGFTGSVIYSGQEQGGSCQDVAVNSVQPLPLVDRWEAYHKSVCSCKDQLQQLENLKLKLLLEEYTAANKSLKSSRFAGGQDESLMHSSLTKYKDMEKQVHCWRTHIIQEVEEGSSWDCLSAFCSCLSDVMKTWRSVDAWIYGKIIAASEDQIESVLQDIDSMFSTYLNLLKHLTTLTDEAENELKVTIRDKIRHLVEKLNSICWHMKEKPQSCHLNTDEMNVSVRLFDFQIENIESVYIFPESDYKNRHTTQYLWAGNQSDCEITGGCATVRNIALKKFYRAPKRDPNNWCVQFYRVSIKLKTHFVDMPIVECLSLPFTIRKGSPQLWEREGAVRCYCFTAVDLYSEPFQCQPKMSIPELLTMLQAMITAAVADKQLDCDEIQALAEMLHTLTKTDRVSLKQFAKDHIQKQGKNRTGVSDFSCFTWFVAAVNTLKYLRQHTCLRECSEFASYDQVKKKEMPVRSAWLRISRNEIETPSGKSPYAHVVVHFYTNSAMESYIVSVSKLKKCPLTTRLSRLKDIDGNRLVETIHPQGLAVEELEKQEQVRPNVYRTAWVKEEIILADLKNLHVSDPGHKCDADLTYNDSSSQVPAKRPRSQTSSTVPGWQPETNKRLSPSFPEILCLSECSDSPQGLQASISEPLPEEQLQLYNEPLPGVLLHSSALPYEQPQKNSMSVLSRKDDVSQEQLQQHPQTLTPVEPRERDLYILLENCEDMDST